MRSIELVWVMNQIAVDMCLYGLVTYSTVHTLWNISTVIWYKTFRSHSHRLVLFKIVIVLFKCIVWIVLFKLYCINFTQCALLISLSCHIWLYGLIAGSPHQVRGEVQRMASWSRHPHRSQLLYPQIATSRKRWLYMQQLMLQLKVWWWLIHAYSLVTGPQGSASQDN